LTRAVRFAAILLAALFAAAPVSAQEGTSGDPVAQWKVLNQQRELITNQLTDLRSRFAGADAEERQKIAGKFRELATQYNEEVGPKLMDAAKAAFLADNSLQEAGEAYAMSAYQANDYEEAEQIASKLLTANPESATAANIRGASLYANHQFEEAAAVLNKLAATSQLDPQIAGRFVEPATEYQDYWAEEQKIRAQQAQLPEGQKLPLVELQTTKGKVVLELFEEEAPNTVANFVSLVESDFYDGIDFHRVIPNFMAQGGDPLTKNENPADDGIGGPGYVIDCECYRPDARKHFAGSISMAHAGKDSGGSQFFLTHLPTFWLNADAQRQSGHTVFGRVVEGLDVARSLEKGDTIESAKVIRKRNHAYKPNTNEE